MSKKIVATLFALLALCLCAFSIWYVKNHEEPVPPELKLQMTFAGSQLAVKQSAEARARAREESEQSAWIAAQALITQLEPILHSPQHTTELPAAINNCFIDSLGRCWLRAHLPVLEISEQAVKKSIELAASGKTRIIFDGLRFILVDRNNRFFIRDDGGTLMMFSGHQWTSFSPPDSTPNPKVRTTVGFAGLEDSHGNVYIPFPAGASGGWVVRIAPDGSLTWYQLDKRSIDLLGPNDPSRCKLVETADSHIIFFRPEPDKYQDPVVLQFDGKSWALIHVTGCRVPGHTTVCIMPQPDGTIRTICNYAHLFVHRDEQQHEGDIAAAIEKLSDADEAARDSATQELVDYGVDATAQLNSALNQAIPEVRGRIELVLSKINDKRNHGDHFHNRIYQDRYQFENCEYFGRDSAGTLHLLLRRLTDKTSGKSFDQAMLRISPAGSWQVKPIDFSQWESEDYSNQAEDPFIDRNGSIWLDNNRRVTRDLHVEPVGPVGFMLNNFIGQDKDGKIYARTEGRIFVYDDSVPPSHEGLLEQVTRYETCIYDPFQLAVWLIEPDTHKLRHWINGSWQDTPKPTLEGINRLVPLCNGALLAISSQDSSCRAQIFDGHSWGSAAQLLDRLRCPIRIWPSYSQAIRFSAMDFTP